MEFNTLLKEKVENINNIIEKFLPECEGKQERVIDAMNYSVNVGGKRVRPMLLAESYKLIGGQKVDFIAPFMAALECIHTYSLVHDDLPAMDNDDYRRGKLTTHKKYGEDFGILAGDGLLNYAYELMLNACAAAEDMESMQRGVRAAAVIAKKSGIYGMVGGQTLDVWLTGKPMNAEEMEFIFNLKTGALIEAALMAGAILAGADDAAVKRAKEAGRLIGVAFQIKDDILDVTSTQDVLGKPVFSDEKNNKTTYVTLYGMEKAVADVEQMSAKAVEYIKELGDNPFLEELILKLISRKNNMILEKINKPNDIKKLDPIEYNQLADEIRQFLVENVSRTGGHLASNLGVVELTMALHIVFNLPQDKLIWDVGHQSYTHKILTGRKAGFEDLRKFGGMSGFPKRNESDYDAFDTGHSSTSISAALGYACAREVKHEHYNVISVIGDGALTGGMAYEALNNASQVKGNFIIVLNDNKMSISKNVGGVSKMLGDIRVSDTYYDVKESVVNTLYKVPCGDKVINSIKQTKSSLKQLIIPNQMFESMGITYLGPVNGHDINKLIKIFTVAKRIDHPVLIHVVTQKGHGYKPAERNPSKFHGVSPFDVKSGNAVAKEQVKTYSDVFSEAICSIAKKDDRVSAVTAAMPDGTGLTKFAKWFPERFYDVGIAEEHAVTFSAGLAAGGLKPVFAVYSSFLQRAYDQILHDVCIQQLHVVFAIDRAGLVGSDGETHQGIFDMSFLRSIPNMTMFAPKNAWELREGLRFALEEFYGPISIRYPRGKALTDFEEFKSPIVYGESEVMYWESDIILYAVGTMVKTADSVRNNLKAKGYNVSLVNARFIKPFDTALIHKCSMEHKLIVTMEENVQKGGFGEGVCQYVNESQIPVSVLNISLPDDYIEHGSVDILRAETGIDADTVTERVISYYDNLSLQRCR